MYTSFLDQTLWLGSVLKHIPVLERKGRAKKQVKRNEVDEGPAPDAVKAVTGQGEVGRPILIASVGRGSEDGGVEIDGVER